MHEDPTYCLALISKVKSDFKNSNLDVPYDLKTNEKMVQKWFHRSWNHFSDKLWIILRSKVMFIFRKLLLCSHMSKKVWPPCALWQQKSDFLKISMSYDPKISCRKSLKTVPQRLEPFFIQIWDGFRIVTLLLLTLAYVFYINVTGGRPPCSLW